MSRNHINKNTRYYECVAIHTCSQRVHIFLYLEMMFWSKFYTVQSIYINFVVLTKFHACSCQLQFIENRWQWHMTRRRRCHQLTEDDQKTVAVHHWCRQRVFLSMPPLNHCLFIFHRIRRDVQHYRNAKPLLSSCIRWTIDRHMRLLHAFYAQFCQLFSCLFNSIRFENLFLLAVIICDMFVTIHSNCCVEIFVAARYVSNHMHIENYITLCNDAAVNDLHLISWLGWKMNWDGQNTLSPIKMSNISTYIQKAIICFRLTTLTFS